MILPGSYANGFAPRDGQPLYPELWRGCVGAWAPCLGPTGLRLRDWSGFSNHGTLTGMDAASDWVMSGGKFGLDFDGVNDHVLCGNYPQTQLVAGMSVSFWLYPTNLTPLQGVISHNSASDNGWMVAIQSGTLRFPQYSQNLVTITANVWTHVTCVRRGTGNVANEIWLNGQIAISSNATDRANTSLYPLVIGRLYGGVNGFYLVGLADDFAVYNRPLSSGEIKLRASRRGIAYELAPRRRSSSAVQFNRRRRLLIGAGS
jgi:hypothetical protein